MLEKPHVVHASPPDPKRRRVLQGALALAAGGTLQRSRAAQNWTVVETARDNGRRRAPVPAPARMDASAQMQRLHVDPALRAQQILGFGGALTESAAYVLQQLPKNTRERVLRGYFDARDGIGYTLARTHINSCDFSRSSWSLDDHESDLALEHFSLAPMRERQLPLIRDVRQIAGAKRFKLLASPWSPPAWMKTNREMAHGGTLRADCREAWARFYVRFAQAMRDEEKIPLWALTVQNEPDATQPWESCLYSPWEERSFIADELGPALEQAGLSSIKLFGWDHNRNGLEERAAALLGYGRSAKYLAGLAIHWYQDEDFAASKRVLEKFPDTQILFTEGCVEGGPHVDEWQPAERYARNIIGDLSNGVCGFIDWNIALDLSGGPNHVGNFCHAPVLVDAQAGQVRVQPSFHYIAHFSSYVQPGAFRIPLSETPAGLQTIAFANPDRGIVVVVCNPGDDAQEFAVQIGDDARVCTIPAHAIQTHIRA